MSVDTVDAMEISQRELAVLQVVVGILDKVLYNFDDRLIGADEHAMDDMKESVLRAKELSDQRLEEVQETINRMQQTLPTAVNGDASTAVNGDASTASTAVNGDASSGGARRKNRYFLSRKLKARSSRKKRTSGSKSRRRR